MPGDDVDRVGMTLLNDGTAMVHTDTKLRRYNVQTGDEISRIGVSYACGLAEVIIGGKPALAVSHWKYVITNTLNPA